MRSLHAVVHRMDKPEPIEGNSCDCHEKNQSNNFSILSASHTVDHNFN